jgi:hypothetical protein
MSTIDSTGLRWRIGVVLALAVLLSPAATGSGAAHEGSQPTVARESTRGAVELHGCWLTAGFVPTTLETIEDAFGSPLALTQTFYGSDPLVGIWGLACERARIERRRMDDVIISLVASPTGLTSEGAVPLANNFAHALHRVDTDSAALAKTLRRAGLPARHTEGARFRHSAPEVVPSTGELVVPGTYRIDVSASALDPTNPHDHVNSFSSVNRKGWLAVVRLFINDALDRFCFPSLTNCRVFVRAHRRSPVRDVFGTGSLIPSAGFDHAQIERVTLTLD